MLERALQCHTNINFESATTGGIIITLTIALN
jgi:hypothetical protein